ncbi:hypothetical protein CROQUDRAFT_42580 [Cronartium quercuum f. sp. fusiforme G11]|uniref:Glycoside hydrolase 131 catalytic N-terminal domain-containing protein n=1 Tax=Cronartium quercuum f. sp. fusiforme G11 TaxID=708437 RepID=A0A9P6NP69_9BASI|nr:hypothetical protein CROQUDRAFT_42580 [Cronartium quercuum f. sp. fusiforme G11]
MFRFSNLSLLTITFLILHHLSITSAELLADGRIPLGIPTKDFDRPNSKLVKKFKQIITPLNKLKYRVSAFLFLVPTAGAGFEQEIGTRLTNDSIFYPGQNLNQGQYGFRRTGVVLQMDQTTTQTDVTAFHLTVRTSSKHPLNISHGYLLGFLENPTVSDHIWDIFYGSDFNSDPTASLPSKGANRIRVRDFARKELYSIPLEPIKLYNFAILCDWNKNELSVFSSIGDLNLQQVTKSIPNDPKAINSATKSDFHFEVIRFPVVNPEDNPTDRGDVVHHGLHVCQLTKYIYISSAL